MALRHRPMTAFGPLDHLQLTLLARVGLFILAAGFLGDALYHSLPGASEALLGAEGYRAHLVTFLGMLLMVIGVVDQGLRR